MGTQKPGLLPILKIPSEYLCEKTLKRTKVLTTNLFYGGCFG